MRHGATRLCPESRERVVGARGGYAFNADTARRARSETATCFVGKPLSFTNELDCVAIQQLAQAARQ